ncbi:MAG: VWA domain-containing protein [Polyangiaceae bacterium]
MSDLIVPFLYELRNKRLKVGTQEAVQLARAMHLGLHGHTLDGFYYLARSLMVHNEADLDRFDEAFLAHFKGIVVDTKELIDQLDEWLKDPKILETLTDEQREALQELSSEELQRMLEERLREQKKRHEGGSKWIGTGGTSPFGTGGQHPSGISMRAQGNKGRGGKGAMGMADARKYRPYRSDLVLDVRQIEVALRKLKNYSREGLEEELDMEATIDATAKNFGELEIVLRRPKKSNVRVLLLMDVGGSMDPFAQTVSQLFSAAKRASNFREVKAYYFHNAVYGRVFSTENLMDPIAVPDLLDTLNSRWKVILVGDAAMAPGELLGSGPWGSPYGLNTFGDGPTGLDWFVHIASKFDHSVWLNPDPPRYWGGGTCKAIGSVFPMFHLTLEGLTEAMARLSKGSVAAPHHHTVGR